MATRAGILVLAALAPAAMLAVDPVGWYWFGPVKWLAVSVLIVAGAALVARHHDLRLARAPTLAALGLLAWLSVAAAWGEDPLYAWIGTPERHFGVLTWALCLLAFVAAQSVCATKGLHAYEPVLAGLVVAGLGLGVLAGAEALGWEPDVFDLGGRLTATFGSAAYLGAATALLLPVCIGVALDARLRRSLRTAAIVAVGPLVVACLGSGARAAWVGLLAALGTVMWTARGTLRRRPKRTAAGVGAALVVVAVIVAATPVGARITAAFDAGEPGGRARLDEWRVATRVIGEHPLLGVGPEGYRIAFAEGADAEYERSHGREPLPDRAHAAPLDIALAGGLPAVVAWLAVIGFVARHARRALVSDHRGLNGLATGLVAYQVGALLLFPIAEIDPIVWLVAGVVVGATAKTDELVTITVPRTLAPVLALATAVALVAGSLDVAADRRARVAVDALARGDTSRAWTAAVDAAGLRPDEVRLHLLLSRAAVADQRGTLAGIAAVDDALDNSPKDPVALRTRASLLVDRAAATMVPEHASRARVEAERLVRADPFNAVLWSLAGEAALLDGDPAAAEWAHQRAEELAPGQPGDGPPGHGEG